MLNNPQSKNLMQRAGFEPAKRCVLGPHPSAFDQAGRPLQQVCHLNRVYQQRVLVKY